MTATIVNIGSRFREPHGPVTVSNLLSWQAMLDTMMQLVTMAQNCTPESQRALVTKEDYGNAAVLVFERNHRYVTPDMPEQVRDLAIVTVSARQTPAPA